MTWQLRLRANGGRYCVKLGTNHEGWNEQRARVELDAVMEQVRRGTWTPPHALPMSAPVEQLEEETIHDTLARWWERKQRDLRPNSQADYLWRLNHLLRYEPSKLTAEVDIAWVAGLTEWLARQPARNRRKGSSAKLSPRSVNMALDVLAQALDDAVEYGVLGVNPARGKRRRLRVASGPRSFLEADMVVELLEVAGEWEASLPEHQRYGRRALLALLSLAGPRISEAIAADRADFDLAAGRWRIPASKTPAGERDIELTMHLAEILRDHVAAAGIGKRSPMFPSRTGDRLNPSNIRTRLLPRCAEMANERRAKCEDAMRVPAITPHSLRRTFASLSFFAGRDAKFVMDQLGHADPRLTLAVYAQTMKRRRVDQALVWRLMRFADEADAPATAVSRLTRGLTR